MKFDWTRGARQASLTLALATAALAPAQALPVELPTRTAPPTAGPAQVDLFTYGYTMLGRQAVHSPLAHADELSPQVQGYLVLESILGSNSAGGDANVLAASSPDGRWFFATAQAPQRFSNPNTPFVGGAAEVLVTRTFRKESDTDELWFSYSNIYLQGGWEKEFGTKCPPGDEHCQWGNFASTVQVWAMTGSDPLWQVDNELEVYSIGNSSTDPGYSAQRKGSFGYIGYVNRYGFELQNPKPLNSSIQVDLSRVGVGELFVVTHQLWVAAVDTASHVAPGRNVEVDATDPLSFSFGNTLNYKGLTPWESLVAQPPAVVPEPSAALLLATSLLPLVAMQRRRARQRGAR
jgi:hypothetical protein